MTVPEENRRKSKKTDDTVTRPDRFREAREKDRTEAPESTTMPEALDEADVTPDDFEGESR
ncbi:hypothetical protein [Streptomyces litchfieldiae]|uniref:Uncharacterized protein n=1 Tax=Streptomyces litchfieldiae TaxID=3075543 RepID=A0ABU2MPM9_9ACTN|nr:hypothetical protein [Streptomyces sp. DSM 44938]MDT0343577.1 hypothetical protein [Streptomyces sp. DSM 44938]